MGNGWVTFWGGNELTFEYHNGGQWTGKRTRYCCAHEGGDNPNILHWRWKNEQCDGQPEWWRPSPAGFCSAKQYTEDYPGWGGEEAVKWERERRNIIKTLEKKGIDVVKEDKHVYNDKTESYKTDFYDPAKHDATPKYDP